MYLTETIPFVDGMVTGMGVNLVNGQTTSLVFPNLKTTVSQKLTPTIRTACIQSSDDYSSFLEVVAGVEGQAWTEEGELSGSASCSFLTKEQINQQSIAFTSYRALLTQVETPSAAQMNGLTLSTAMQQKIQSHPGDFLNEYGTHVITGFIYGGSIMVCVNIRAYSQSDVTDIKTAFNMAINEFELGSAKITSSLASFLSNKATLFSTIANANGVGVSVPSLNISNLDDVQDYIDGTGTYLDTGFTDELGVGVKVMAVCEPWETLPCIASGIPGYNAGSLSPGINMSLVDELRNENRRLTYGIQTAEWMQENNSWVGPVASAQLQAALTMMSNAKGVIQNLTLLDLTNLTSSSIAQYIVSPGVLPELAAIAAGRTSFFWWAGLDGAFTPNSLKGAITGTLIALPQSSPNVVLTAKHGGDTASLGILYTLNPVTTPTQLQSRVSVQGSFQFGTSAATTGMPLALGATTEGSASKAAWSEQYDYDNISVVYTAQAAAGASGG